MNRLTRRRVLRGILNGGAVTVGLPLLDFFLNDNGTALANGAPLPVRFGTWFWGLGMQQKIFVPQKTGAGWEVTEETQALKPIQQHINVFTNFQAFRDDAQNFCHHTGWVVSRTGIAPATLNVSGETLDVTIANQISRTRRFKTLNAAAHGDARLSVSYENANTPIPPEFSPISLYTRLFGPDFQDPNASDFRPDPRAIARKSVLSAVTDEIKDLNQKVGTQDRARLDQYFTGLRQLEQQFDQQLTKPEPRAACRAPEMPRAEPKLGNEVSLVAARHKMLTDLMVMAVACDQTRVFNMAYSAFFANTTKPGYEKPHHTTTHEESVDEKLGYQPTVSWFTRRSMEAWVDFVQAFANCREGDGTLLDNVFIMGTTDTGFARIHALDNMAMFTAGRAGGKIRTGLHVDGRGTSVTRLGYTAMRVVGLDAPSWGTNSNRTSDVLNEIVV